MQSPIIALVVSAVLLASDVAAQPANDDCANAIVIPAVPFSDTVDTTAATTEPGDPACYLPYLFNGPPAPEPNSIWYAYTPTVDVRLRVDVGESDYLATATVVLGSCGSFGVVDCDEGLGYNDGAVDVPVRAGTTAYIEIVDTDDSGGGMAVVHVDETPIAPGTPLHTGLDFQANVETEYDPGYQREPDVASAPGGSFVVVWGDETDGDNYGIVARRFDATAVPISGELLVNTYTTSRQRYPSVAMSDAGEFVVVWESSGQLDGGDIVARRFDSGGLPIGGEIVVNTFTTGAQRFPSVAMAGPGEFVVVWASAPSAGGGPAVIARRFDSAGGSLGGELQISTTAPAGVSYPGDGPELALREDGRFAVVWTDASYRPVMRVFDAATPVGDEIDVAAPGAGGRTPDVTFGPTGGLLVAWESGVSEEILGRLFDGSGVAQSSTFVVSDPAIADYPYAPTVAANAEGDFVVAWTDETYYTLPDANGSGVRGRRFSAAGEPVGDELQVNTYAVWDQRYPKIAMADGGGFVVVWEDYTEDSRDRFGPGVFGHRFELPPLPTGCPAAPRASCKQPTTPSKGRIVLKDKVLDAKDVLVWKWQAGEATSLAELGDPLTSDALSLCLYDGSGSVISTATVQPGGLCGGKPCWKATGDVGFRFVDKTVSQDGILKLLLRTGESGRSKLVVKAKGEALAMPALPPTLPLTAQLGIAGGTCWEAQFEAGGVQKASPAVFGAQAAGPS